MITRTDTVLIGKTCPASYGTTVDELSQGAVALFDENKSLIKKEADAAKASTVYIGVVGDNMTIALPNGTSTTKRSVEYSNAIQKASKPSYVQGNYVAPVQEKIEIDLTSATVAIGHRYVLRIVYKDLYEAPGQFTHTYEVIASTEIADDLGKALLEKINKHTNRRVSAAFAAHKLTLTALPKDDDEGVYSLNEYSVVSMEASLYVTIPGALLSNVPEAVPGATITKTAGKPGKGYWKQVRDMEVRMLGYKGHVFTDAYPIIEPKRNVTKDMTYDYITIENDNLYLSPDNQYIKTTPLTTELYVESSAHLGNSTFVGLLKAFITGVASAA
jgi:hypothetical protein